MNKFILIRWLAALLGASRAAEAENIAIHCAFADGSAPNWEISDARVVENGELENTKNVVITNRVISWEWSFSTEMPMQMQMKVSIDRSTGIATWTITTTQKTQITSGQCTKIGSAQRKF